MGNAQVMTAKVAWDNACYWAITALLFFQRRLRQPEFMASIDPLMRRFFVLHARMQQFLRAWDDADRRDRLRRGLAERGRRRLPAPAAGRASAIRSATTTRCARLARTSRCSSASRGTGSDRAGTTELADSPAPARPMRGADSPIASVALRRVEAGGVGP